MTLDEAIKWAEEIADANERNAKIDTGGIPGYSTYCLENAKKYKQIVEWFKELKEIKENR